MISDRIKKGIHLEPVQALSLAVAEFPLVSEQTDQNKRWENKMKEKFQSQASNYQENSKQEWEEKNQWKDERSDMRNMRYKRAQERLIDLIQGS